MRRTLVLVMLLTVLPALVWAGTPTEAIQQPLERGMEVLRDPAYANGANREEQRDKIWEIIKEVFDFRLISARALGRDWKRLTKAERAEFMDVFSQLLGKTYIGRVQGEYQDEHVLFTGEELVSEKKAIVQSVVIQKNHRIPVEYNLRRKNDQWRIYDIKVEGIGLVLNYRRQFSTFLATPSNTPADLIAQLKNKLEDE
jgi:phospholipid transport system substrate-binding protein